MSGIPFFAKRFVAGTDLNGAVAAAKSLNQTGIMTSLDILGESVENEQVAREAETSYEGVAGCIPDNNLNSHISIKPTMLGLDISNELAEELLRKLLTKAKEANTFVRIDMEGSAHTDRTIDLFLKFRKEFDNVGIVLQAMLHRTADDMARVNEAGGRIRLCKGAYKEPAEKAFQGLPAIRENYIKLAETLLKEGHYPAFASHDDILINAVKEMLPSSGRDVKDMEFQMLYGLRRKTWHKLVADGYNMRVYVPFGTHWFPYFSRRLRESKENVMFLMKTFFKG